MDLLEVSSKIGGSPKSLWGDFVGWLSLLKGFKVVFGFIFNQRKGRFDL